MVIIEYLDHSTTMMLPSYPFDFVQGTPSASARVGQAHNKLARLWQVFTRVISILLNRTS